MASSDLIVRASDLGRSHRAEGIQPFGDICYVRWDAGSGDLLAALGITAPTTEENHAEREQIVVAYCGALAGADPEG